MEPRFEIWIFAWICLNVKKKKKKVLHLLFVALYMLAFGFKFMAKVEWTTICDILKNNPTECVALSDTWLTDEHGESYD